LYAAKLAAEERGEMDLAAKLEREYKETMKEKEKVSSTVRAAGLLL
jgi:hypothetical protein